MSIKLIAIIIACTLWAVVRIVKYIGVADCDEWVFYGAFESFPDFLAFPLIYLTNFIKCSLLPIFVGLLLFLIFF